MEHLPTETTNNEPSVETDVCVVTPQPESQESAPDRTAREMLERMALAEARLDVEGASRLGEHWSKAVGWAKAGWEWAKKPSETYTEAVGKAALFSAGTTVFLAPVFLYRNCKQVYDARRGAPTQHA